MWAAALQDALDDVAATTADELAAVISRTLADRPFFCALLSHAALNLERGCPKSPSASSS